MIRPRTFHGWKDEAGKYHVSLYVRSDPKHRGSNIYDSKADAELECIKERTDPVNGAPLIVWEAE